MLYSKDGAEMPRLSIFHDFRHVKSSIVLATEKAKKQTAQTARAVDNTCC